MTETKLRNQIGIFIILSNILVILSTLVMFFLDGFLAEEVTTIIALIVPMFSVYTTAIIKNIIENSKNIKDESPIVSSQYVFISWLFPTLFTLYLLALIFLKAFNIGFDTFDQFKQFLVGSETIFGAYVGLIVSSMFKIDKKSS